MSILTTISIETATVIVTTLVAAIIAPFARRLGHSIFFRLIKRNGAATRHADRNIARAGRRGEGA